MIGGPAAQKRGENMRNQTLNDPKAIGHMPGGKKPIPEELKNRLRNLSSQAADALDKALGNPDDCIRIAAATILLDRAYGKPAQATDMTLTGGIDASQVHLQALLEQVRKRAAEPIH